MKITHNKVGQNLNITDAKKTDKTEKSSPAGRASIFDLKDSNAGASKVDVSSRAQDMKKIKDIANSAPDVDEAKVARLQKLIDDGKYNVDADSIADKMVDEHLMFT